MAPNTVAIALYIDSPEKKIDHRILKIHQIFSATSSNLAPGCLGW